MAIVLKGGDVRFDIEGEGSRGGKVIGHTSSGKPIYNSLTHKGHQGFNEQEKREVRAFNSPGMKKAQRESNQYNAARKAK
jgi:hypothetical protein